MYDENHPDEFADGHHPFLLMHEGDAIGAIRIDIKGTTAIVRRVAIREDVQRRGHGSAMLALAEEFVRDKGCQVIQSFVNPDAVRFYEHREFTRDISESGDTHHVPMRKHVSPNLTVRIAATSELLIRSTIQCAPWTESERRRSPNLPIPVGGSCTSRAQTREVAKYAPKLACRRGHTLAELT